MSERRSFTECPNCGAPTPDAYCSSCGQRNLDLHESVRALIGDAFEEVLGAFLERTQSFYRTAFVMMLPAFALVLMALYRRDRFIIDSWIPQVTLSAAVGFALAAVYSLVALRTMYGESALRTLLKGTIFGISVAAITVAGMLALMTLALLSI